MTESEFLESLQARALKTEMELEQRQGWQQKFNQWPAMSWFGIGIDVEDDYVAKIILPTIEEHHQGGLGTTAVNGAVISAMFDVAIGTAGIMQCPGRRLGTVELSIKLMNPVRVAPVTAYAIAIKRSMGGLVFAESFIYSGDLLCGQCSGMVAASKSAALRETSNPNSL